MIKLMWHGYKKGVVQVDDESVHVPRQPMEILFFLMVHRGNFCPVEDLISAIWPDPDQEPDYAHDMVKVYICRLRKILGRDAIETHYGRGYMMIK